MTTTGAMLLLCAGSWAVVGCGGDGGIDKSYCVAGNELHILKISTGSTGQTAIESDLVAMKR